jgi:hypothetical protein
MPLATQKSLPRTRGRTERQGARERLAEVTRRWYSKSTLELIVRAALEALNRLVADRVIENYAIGGAIGASFYLPAMQTEDLDVFVFLPRSYGPLVTLAPVYAALEAQGGVAEGQDVRFGKWPVQILKDANALIAEAIREAASTDFDGIPTRVFSAEHLCAIALQTCRTMPALGCSLTGAKWTWRRFQRLPRVSGSRTS